MIPQFYAPNPTNVNHAAAVILREAGSASGCVQNCRAWDGIP